MPVVSPAMAVTPFPLGCFAPEPTLTPPPTGSASYTPDSCAAACAAGGLPFAFLLTAAAAAASPCRCAKAYNTSGFSMPIHPDGKCDGPLLPGYAWSNCELGASFAVMLYSLLLGRPVRTSAAALAAALSGPMCRA